MGDGTLASGELTSGGTVSSSGGSISSVGNFSQAGGSIIGSITIDAGGDVTQKGGIVSGSITISAGGSVGIDLGQSNALTSADLTAHNGSIAFNNASGGGLSLTASAAAAGGAVNVTESGNLTIGAGGIKAGGGITLAASGDLVVTDGVSSTGGKVEFTGAGITLGAGVSGAGDIRFNNPVTLSADLTVSSGGGNVTFTSTVDGAHDLTINQADNVTFGGNAGSSASLGDLSITAADFDILSPAAELKAANISLTGTGDLTIGNVPGDEISAVELSKLIAASRLQIEADSSHALAVEVTITASVPELTLAAGKEINLGFGITNGGGKITLDGAVSLGADVTLDTSAGAGDIEFTGPLKGNKNLALKAGTGGINFAGAVGGTSPADAIGGGTGAAISIESAYNTGKVNFAGTLMTNSVITIGTEVEFGGSVTIGGNGGPQSHIKGPATIRGAALSSGNTLVFGDSPTDLTDAVTLGSTGPVTVEVTGPGGDLEFWGALGGTQGFTVRAAGTLTFHDDVAAGALTVEAGGLILDGTADLSTKSNGNITIIADAITNNSNSINAGTGAVRFSPLTVTKTIAYGPSSGGTVLGISIDVWYSSSWSDITAGLYLIGRDTHQGNIYLDNVGTTPIELTADNGAGTGASGTITVIGTYKSLDKPLQLKPGSGGLVLHDAVTIDLGDAEFVCNANAALEGNGDSSVSARGGITIGSVVEGAASGANGITLDAGTGGSVTLNGNMGDPVVRLGAVNVTGSAVGLKGVYSGAAVTVSNSGVLTLNAEVEGDGGFTQIGGGVTLADDAALSTVAGGIALAGSVSGLGKNLTLTAGTGSITLDGALGGSGAGLGEVSISGGGTSLKGNIYTNNKDITVTGSLTLASGAGGVILNTGTGIGGITLGGPVSGAGEPPLTLTVGMGDIDLAGDLGSTGVRLGEVSISGGGTSLKGNIYTNNKDITVAGSLVLASGAGGVTLDTGTGIGGITLGGPVSGAGEDLTLEAGTGGITLNGDLGDNTGRLGTADIRGGAVTLGADVSTEGDITFATAPDGVILAGNSTVSSAGGNVWFNSNVKIPQGFAMTADCPAGKTVSIAGNVELYGRLDAGPYQNSDVTITVGGNWKQTDVSGNGVFNPHSGTVAFTGTDVEIDGVTTTWYNLGFTNPAGATIKFRNYPYPAYTTAPSGHRIGGVFSIVNGAAGRLTRLDSSQTFPPGELSRNDLYDYLSANRADRFWNLFYDPGKNTVFDALKDTEIEWCWLRPTISKDMKIPRIGDWISSYVISSLNNVGWSAPYLVYSFTEDWDYNGRIDHIRVQAGAPMNRDIADFRANVAGYNVTGYELHPGTEPFSRYLFYIKLEEKDFPDTGERPLVLDITGVKDISGRPFNLLDSAKTPIDTAPPQVVYSLALPGGNELFIRMSEPVEFAAGFEAALLINGTGGASVVPVTSLSGKYSEFKITAPSPLTAEDIAAEKNIEFAASSPGYFYDPPVSFIYPPRIGSSQFPGCYLIWPKDRKYEYGRSGGYEDIAPPWTGAPETKITRNYNMNNDTSYDYVYRLSDLLLAPPQASAGDPFFALPVFAHDLTGAANTDPRTRIFEFDGSGELMDMDVTVQAKLSDAAWAAGIRGLELRYSTDKRIPEEFRSKEAFHGTEGLWLPDGNSSVDKTALVPRPYKAGSSVGVPAPGNRLYNFTIPGSNLLSYTNVEFYLTAKKGGSRDLIIARLDAKDGASLPWYRRIKPFSFRLREMVSQRGGATILNNVINPDRGDRAVLHYLLARGGRVTIQVFTLDGNLVKVLERSSKGAGEYAVSWDGRNKGGRVVARGLYFIRIVGPDIDEIRKVMVVK
ncbi:MAG: hypothetical protein LBR93_02260 [Treponema sp.]|nr:hypothetical protein [Treponema sp.]